MKNVLKVVFLGLMGFGLLVYLTLPSKNEKDFVVLNINSFPKSFELIGKKAYGNIGEFFRKGEEKYILFLNHDALAVFKDLKETKNVVLIANLSNTPWIIKQLAVDGKLEELFKNSKNSLINDNGSFLKVLNFNDTKQNVFYIYKLQKDGLVKEVYKGIVKMDALANGIEEGEKNRILEDVSKILEKF